MLERWSICSAYVSNILLQKDLPCAPLRSSRGAGVSPKISAPPMRPALLSRLDILGPNQAIHTAVSIATPEVRIFLSTADRLRAWSSPWPEAVQRTEGVNVTPPIRSSTVTGRADIHPGGSQRAERQGA